MAHLDFEIPIIILAAGASARMRGRDKLLELVDSQPLLRRQARIARLATAGPVLITLPAAPHPRYDVLAGLDVTQVPVADAAEGMSASLRAGFAALGPDHLAAMVFLADMPELTLQDIRKILEKVDFNGKTQIWRGATETGQPGHPILFAADLFAELARLRGDNGGRDVVARAQAAGLVKLVPLPGTHASRDLDTPEDWAAWRAEHRKNADP